MKLRTVLGLILIALAAAAGWWAGSRRGTPAPAATSDRRILYYQSSMHPWIKSDQPGKCTICGMDLAPVFEGESGFSAASDVITLNSNSITVSHVQTVPVVRQPVVRTVRLSGVVDDDDSRHRILSAYVEGRMERWWINVDGAEVKAGQPLGEVYSPMLLAGIREYLALVRGGPGSEPLRRAAAFRLLQMGLLADQIEQLPGTFGDTNLLVEIRSPLAGTVVERDIYAGQTVTAGQRLLELADFSTMWLQLEAYEDDLAWLRPGQSVMITSPSLPGRIFTNAIAYIDPNLSMTTRSTRVRVEIPNPLLETPTGSERLLRHRVLAQGRVRTESAPVLTVPRSAVLNAGQPKVFVEVSNGTYQPRTVTLGRVGDTDVEVVSGLSEGERVVSQGALLLDGQAQLNSLSQTSAPSPTPVTVVTLPAWNAAESSRVREFLTALDALRESLSQDSVVGFNAAAPRVHSLAPGMAELLSRESGEAARGQELVRLSHLETAADLESARKQFHPLSEWAVQLGRQLRARPEFVDLKLYECPMTKRAFPGAPARATWMQLTAPIRNPYFGAEMLDCGTEVRP